MPKINFEVVSVKGTRKWSENGKPRQETKEFFQTLNPFNKNEDGTLKTKQQAFSEITLQRDAWLAEFNPNQTGE